MTYRAGQMEWTGGGGGVSDGVKGDITVSSSGTVWTVDAVAWSAVTGAPSTYPPETHSHAISGVTGLQAALDGKQVAGSYAASSHGHTIGDTTGLQAALDGKQASGSYAAASHTHIIGDVTGLQTALDGKQASGSYQPLATVLTNTTAAFTTAQETKLSGIATGATVNSADATLLARANHTGTQAAGTITGLANVATSGSAADLTGNLAVARLAGGTGASGSTFWRGDGTWSAPSGGSDPWTYIKLTSDYNNATTTFTNITDGTVTFTFTPAADTDWTMDARVLIWTTTATNLPRIGAAIAAGATRGMGGVNIRQAGATATTTVQANGAWNNAAGITVAQIAAGGVLTASVPYLCEVTAHGRSGAAPTAISLQMACETAAASTCYVKRGSFMRYRTI